MPSPNPLRTSALRSAALLLAEAADALPAGPLTVTVTDGYHDVCITISPCRYSLLQPDPGEPVRLQDLPVPPALTPLDVLILAQATAEPRSLAWLANRCGHDADSYFRGRVRRLVQLGLLSRDFRGYRRARSG